MRREIPTLEIPSHHRQTPAPGKFPVEITADLDFFQIVSFAPDYNLRGMLRYDVGRDQYGFPVPDCAPCVDVPLCHVDDGDFNGHVLPFDFAVRNPAFLSERRRRPAIFPQHVQLLFSMRICQQPKIEVKLDSAIKTVILYDNILTPHNALFYAFSRNVFHVNPLKTE
nr:MAG TPA: hypothetical protein [Caudoviricetes sp.]